MTAPTVAYVLLTFWLACHDAGWLCERGPPINLLQTDHCELPVVPS